MTLKNYTQDSDVTKRNGNGQTKSGSIFSYLFQWNGIWKGFIDIYGMPVFTTS